ncbi:M48 family metalloprotease [Dysgonomonas sp. HDW5B]|uniref:M48 family metalloprotease n=1 Tax=Dysgonomonas sp. HDW5B TaxID=2714927 RepID=UPI00140A9BD5|nr:M48 family metalloprotease [Dysgonomonas sp. HDW5B]QIK54116.1 M48 family metalloprotease [Dysgonomonas sp. HDW5B]
MKKYFLALALLATFSFAANAQFGKINVGKVTDAATKGVKAMTLSDAEISQYAQEYIDWIDAHNPVCSVTDTDQGKRETAERLAKIAAMFPIDNVNGKKLDIKALYVVDVNAFACANGSIRVFAGLMDIMTDDEILAVMGHEIGHVVNNDSKDAFKTALLTSALKDAVGSTGNTAAALTDSQLGSLGEALAGAQFSQKQESAADDYGYNLLKQANQDPKAMAQSLGVLLKLEQEAGAGKTSKATQLFSSHPGLEKRIANLEKKK